MKRWSSRRKTGRRSMSTAPRPVNFWARSRRPNEDEALDLCYNWFVLTLNPALVQTEMEIAESPALLVQAQQGDSDCFCQLCRIHGTRLLRQATALCADPALAEDLAQET